MNSATKVGVYALGLAVVFGGAAGVGKAAGPIGGTAEMASHEGGTGGHGTGGHGGAAAGHAPGGLQVSETATR